MSNQKGLAHLFLLLVIIVVIAVGAFLFFTGKFKTPNISLVQKTEPKVAIRMQYQNPFKKENQYVNPFDEYKSPFLTFEKK